MENKRILVIDDEPDILKLIQRMLQLMTRWEVLAASSGQSGLELAQRERPDAILLDVMMPDMDGFTVFRHLQEQEATRGIPVFLLTARVQLSDQRDYEQAGIKRVIAKPFDPPALITEVMQALGWER